MLSTEDELPESCVEDVFIAESAVSRLDDEFERLRLDVWFVEMFAFVPTKATSILLEEDENC
jgi:hypothetical protein